MLMQMTRREDIIIETLLRKADLKATKPRIAIYRVLQKQDKPLSIGAILGKLSGLQIDQVTLYRTIKSFKEAGLVIQVDFQHDHAHYELTARPHHHHLICIHCSRVEDVEACDVAGIIASVLQKSSHFSKISAHSLEFYGICRFCAGTNV